MAERTLTDYEFIVCHVSLRCSGSKLVDTEFVLV